MAEKSSKRLYRITFIRWAVSMVILLSGGLAYFTRSQDFGQGKLSDLRLYNGHAKESLSRSRRLLLLYLGADDAENDTDTNCTDRGITKFPKGIFTNEQRLHGALVINFMAAIYLCGTIGYVCSTYFVPSLEIMCERLNLQTDVAGATFMAAGSSAPELFVSVIGIFISHDDTGLSAIVGSAAFNIFIIIALCCLFAGHVLYLNWWPFVRDCVIYVISIVLMVIFINDSKVEWWEGFILFLGYVVYIIIMYFNPYLSLRADELTAYWHARKEAKVKEKSPDTVGLLADHTDQPNEPTQRYGTVTPNKLEGSPDTVGLLADHTDKPYDPTRRYGSLTTTELGNSSKNDHAPTSNGFLSDGKVDSDAEKGAGSNCTSPTRNRHRTNTNMSLSCSMPADYVPLSERHRSVFTPPSALGFRILWVVGLPVVLLTFLTIPDCRKSGLWRRFYFASFLLATVWLAGASYILYWMIVVIGYTLDIPDTVMGISLLAGGTSVPDAIASVLVARDGYGDMALSNIIGSNIFEVFVCLGMLWFIYGLTYSEPIEIVSEGLSFTTISLLLTVAFILVAIHLNGWKLDFKMGIICLFVYTGFISFAIVWEMGLIGEITPPKYCPGPP